VVGADGIWSRLRTQWLGPTPPRYLGLIVVLGRAPSGQHPLTDQTVFQTLALSDQGTRIFAMPFVPGVTMWQLSFPLPLAEAEALSAAGSTALLAEAVRRCADWHAPVPELLARTRAEDVTGYPIYDRAAPEMRRRPAGEAPSEAAVLLIGDAAHPVSPFKGQGANQAMLDAWSEALIVLAPSCVALASS
jgi:2-polyprenyl-6-methoxyphenol hydroxylase-like FAD-dependent oxidoreductase